MKDKIQRPLPSTGGKSRFHLFVAAALAIAGFPVNASYRTVDESTKLKPHRKPKLEDQDAMLRAELKRTRKAAKRLRNSYTF